MASPRCPHTPFCIQLLNSEISFNCHDCDIRNRELWICLYKNCYYIGCSENDNNHSTQHYKENPTHCVQMSVSYQNIWCYECGDIEGYSTSQSSMPTSNIDSSHYQYQLSNKISGNGGKHIVVEKSNSIQSPIVDSQDSSDMEDDEMLDNNFDGKPRGLVGLQNIGNTCYMNSAIQALSNTPPLTQYFLDCGASVDFLTDNKKNGLSRSYQKLVKEIWHKNTHGYVVPNSILYGIRHVHPMFKGYHQHDTQEFLRCFMDQLHEELKEPIIEEKLQKHLRSKTGYITRQPVHKNSISYSIIDPYSTIDKSNSKILQREGKNEREKGLNQMRRSPARSYDNIPSAAVANRINKHSENIENEYSSLSCHRRSASYCDPRGYYQLPQDKSESLTSSLQQESPIDSEDHECSEKELDDDDEDTYETCDSGTSESVSLNGEDNCSLQINKGFKRKSDCETSERHSEVDEKENSNSSIIRYRSVISDVFDGRLLSSVQCLTCDRISTRVETFQDLSLPIPSRDHMAVLHNGNSTNNGNMTGNCSSGSSGRGAVCSDAVYSATSSQEGWVWWLLGWLRSWFYGPAITLHDCLAAFFSADELKGDNMYSCEKCNKLRNGIKFSKVLGLPEVLCVHLKRFRHELMSSTKIGSKVTFPLTGLDMRPYLHKDCTSSISTYELVAIICHSGTAGGGHYTCVAKNHQADQWFEFDDQCVTSLTFEQVAACEAYVLFYKKSNPRMGILRQKALELLDSCNELNDIKFYVSKQWINRFNTYAEPGPIDNQDFLCPHGGVQPDRIDIVERLTIVVSQSLWEFLYENFGGGPVCNHLHLCAVCRLEKEKLQRRQINELKCFSLLHKAFLEQASVLSIYAISMSWFRTWQTFVRMKTQQPPGPIDNTLIIKTQDNKSAPLIVKPGSDYAQLSEELWRFFYDIYGGGPEILLKSEQSSSMDNTIDHHTQLTSVTNKSINSKSVVNKDLSKPDNNSTSQYLQQSDILNQNVLKSNEDSEGNFNNNQQTKSLSYIDLVNPINKIDNSKISSVKGTQSLQDVSDKNTNIIYEKSVQLISNDLKVKEEGKNNILTFEAHKDSIDSKMYNGTETDFNSGRITFKCSNDISSDDSEHYLNSTKSKKNIIRKSRRAMLKANSDSLKSSQSVDCPMTDVMHQNIQRVENVIDNSVSNKNDSVIINNNSQYSYCDKLTTFNDTENIIINGNIMSIGKSHMLNDHIADVNMDINLENIMKYKNDLNPEVHINHALNKTSHGKHKKDMKKPKRYVGGIKKNDNNTTHQESGDFTPILNGGEKISK